MALLLNIGSTKDAYLISYNFPWFKHNQLEQTIVVAYKAYSESASSNNSARLLTLGHYQSNSSEYLDLIQYWTSNGGTEVPSTRFNPLSNPSLPSGYNSGNDRLLAINSFYAGSSLHLMATSVELDNDLQVMYTNDNKLRAYNHSELVNIAQHLTIGTFNENNILTRAWLGEIYYVAVLNRPLQSTELQSIAAGDVMLLDDYRSNLYELWDFGKAERDEAFTGLISGTVMDAIGTAWSLTGESKYPVSRDTPSYIQGQLGTSIHDAPAWLSTLDSSPGGGPIYASGDGTSTGTSSASGIGETVASSVATVAGIGIVTGYSAVTKAMVGNSTGISVVAATSSSGSTESGVATSTGASTVTGVVQALASSIGTATGNSVSTGVSTVAISRAGVSAGSSTVTGYGTTGDIRNGIGSSTGISTVTATGEWSVVATGSSNGISTVSGNSASIRATTGTSIATATVTGISSTSTVKLGMGSSAGLSVVDGISNSILYRTGIGSSIGSSTAIGYITYDVSNSAAAHGIATVNGVGYALIPPPLPEESRHVPGLTLELSLDKTGLNISV